MDRRRPLLLNAGEIATDEALAEAAHRSELTVLAKVRVASALDIDRSGLTDEEYGYALRSEFDFVVADGEQRLPQFAVEFDEPHHLTDPTTIARDRLKSSVCAKLGLPLVRIGSEFLKRERRFTLIGYLVEVWSLERAFTAGQEAGQIPWDEPFIPENVIAESLDASITWPYWLDLPARTKIGRAHLSGSVAQPTPEELTVPRPRAGEPDVEIVESWALVPLVGNGYVFGQARLRNFPVFISGVTARNLAASVAVADAGRQLDLVLSGEAPPASGDDLAVLRGRTTGWTSQGMPIK
jgi:hypothetical protein